MPLLLRRRVLVAKIETTIGTAISVSGTDGAFNAYDVSILPTIDTNARQGQGEFSQLPQVPGARMGVVKFKTDFLGGVSAPAWMTTFLPACGWVDTAGTYSPISASPGASVKTLTIAVYEDGLKKAIAGAMGTWVLSLENGKPAMIEFTFTGKWVAPTDVSIVAPDYPTTLPPRFASSAMTIGAFTPLIATATIDAGNEVQMRPDVTDVTGYISAIVSDRKPKITLNPESSLVATKDHYGAWLASTEEALSIPVGTTGNKVTIAAPKLQINNIQEADRGKVQIEQIDYQCNRSADAGDDELTLAYS